jgi:hypothetical protein
MPEDQKEIEIVPSASTTSNRPPFLIIFVFVLKTASFLPGPSGRCSADLGPALVRVVRQPCPRHAMPHAPPHPLGQRGEEEHCSRQRRRTPGCDAFFLIPVPFSCLFGDIAFEQVRERSCSQWIRYKLLDFFSKHYTFLPPSKLRANLEG